LAKLNDGIPASKKAASVYMADQDPNKKVFVDAEQYQISAPWYEGKTTLIWEYIPQKLVGPFGGKGNMNKAIKDINDLIKK